LADDAARPDHTIAADVGHDYRAVADPGIAADPKLREAAALLLDRLIETREVMLMPAAQHIHVAADSDIFLDRHPADGATIADIDSAADADLPVRDRGAEPETAIGRQLVQSHPIEPTPYKDTELAGKEAEQ